MLFPLREEAGEPDLYDPFFIYRNRNPQRISRARQYLFQLDRAIASYQIPKPAGQLFRMDGGIQAQLLKIGRIPADIAGAHRHNRVIQANDGILGGTEPFF